MPFGKLPSLDSKNCLNSSIGPAPAGSRVLKVNYKAGSSFPKRPKTSSAEQKVSDENYNGHRAIAFITVGVFRSQAEFVAQAMIQPHPFDLCRALPDSLLQVISSILMEGPVFVMRHRLNLLAKWKAWKRELATQEAEPHRSLEPGVASILRCMSLLLLERIAVDLGWPDSCVHKEMREGFRLIGESRPSGVFPVKQKPAAVSIDEFFQQAKYLRPTIWGSISNSECNEFSQALFHITIEESLEKGWLEPPLSEEDLDIRFPNGWIPVRRFGIMKRNKLRPIDDLSENGVNSAYMVSDKLTLRTMDELMWVCAALMGFIRCKGEVGLQVSTGIVLSGSLHEFWVRGKDRSRPVVKTVDLEAAYKQLPCTRVIARFAWSPLRTLH